MEGSTAAPNLLYDTAGSATPPVRQRNSNRFSTCVTHTTEKKKRQGDHFHGWTSWSLYAMVITHFASEALSWVDYLEKSPIRREVAPVKINKVTECGKLQNMKRLPTLLSYGFRSWKSKVSPRRNVEWNVKSYKTNLVNSDYYLFGQVICIYLSCIKVVGIWIKQWMVKTYNRCQWELPISRKVL